MARAGGSRPRVTIAGRPSGGHGVIVKRLADGRVVVAVGRGSQTGWDIDFAFADAYLRMLVSAAAGPGIDRGYAEAIAAMKDLVDPDDDGFDGPSVTAIVVVCSSRRVELSWVGHDKAYLVRERGREWEVVAETIEHSIWRMIEPPLELPEFGRPFTLPSGEEHATPRVWLGLPSRKIEPRGCMPDSLVLSALRSDEALVLVSSVLHRRVDWRMGVERALSRVERLDADVLHRELGNVAKELGSDEWIGPVVVIGR